MTVRVLEGDCRAIVPTLPDASVQCCITSPPYFGLRDYGVDGQIGLESNVDEYVAEMVAVFRGVRRVLRDDATLWLNLGDSYAGNGRGNTNGGFNERWYGKTYATDKQAEIDKQRPHSSVPAGLKPKDLIGVPWMVAFALRADGWYLRSDIIWAKKNCMPESIRDRPTKSHEYIFLLSKKPRYFYDAESVKEESTDPASYEPRTARSPDSRLGDPLFRVKVGNHANGKTYPTRNARSVWHMATMPFAEAHFATFPPELAERCIKAGTKEGDTVLDPFAGAGTTGLVADRLQRDAILIELNPTYASMSRKRITNDAPLFAMVE